MYFAEEREEAAMRPALEEFLADWTRFHSYYRNGKTRGPYNTINVYFFIQGVFGVLDLSTPTCLCPPGLVILLDVELSQRVGLHQGPCPVLAGQCASLQQRWWSFVQSSSERLVLFFVPFALLEFYFVVARNELFIPIIKYPLLMTIACNTIMILTVCEFLLVHECNVLLFLATQVVSSRRNFNRLCPGSRVCKGRCARERGSEGNRLQHHRTADDPLPMAANMNHHMCPAPFSFFCVSMVLVSCVRERAVTKSVVKLKWFEQNEILQFLFLRSSGYQYTPQLVATNFCWPLSSGVLTHMRRHIGAVQKGVPNAPTNSGGL